MALFSALLGIGSTLLGIKGASDQAKAQKTSELGNAKIAALNADIARENQRDVEIMGRDNITAQFAKINQALGATRAAVAGAGLVVDAPGTTTQQLVDDMAFVGALDIRRLRENIRLEKRKFKRDEESFSLQEQFGITAAGSISPGLAGFTAGVQGVSNNFDLIF